MRKIPACENIGAINLNRLGNGTAMRTKRGLCMVSFHGFSRLEAL